MLTIEREWLKKARIDRGLKQKDLAAQLGISEQYYSYIESGTRQKKMDVMLINGLSVALGMPVMDVIKEETNYAEM